MKGKNTLAKLLPVLLILGAFFFISEMFKEKERTSFAVDREAFIVVDSEEELKERLGREVQYFDPEMFKLMEKHNLITEIENVNIPVVEEQREFRIESLYNQGLGLFMTYSLDVLPNDESPDDIPYFEFDRLKLTADGEDPLELGVGRHGGFQDQHWQSDGVVFQNRIYRRVVYEPDWNEKVLKTLSSWVNSKEMDNFDHINEAIMKISKIELQEVELVKKGNAGGEKFALQDIALDYQMKSQDPLLESVSVNKSTNLGNGRSITYTDFETRLHQKRLYFEMNSPLELNEVYYKYGKIEGQSSVRKDADGRQYIEIYHDPYNGDLGPDEPTISLLSGSYPTDEELTFTITKDEFQKFRAKMEQDENVYEINRDLGVVNTIDFELVKLEINPNGPHQDNYGFFLKVDPEHEYDRHIYFQSYERYLETIKEHPEAEMHFRGQPMMEVKDQDGNPVRADQHYSDESGHFYGFEPHSFDEIEELNIRIFNLPMYVDFAENEVSLGSE
ncbi:hypothetical protein ACSVDE_06365 [Pseudalkalibacillus sp. Hm43]|uniref:hypothetical protein n=1 Tax=Pseudalkalibacillus sp. Hm43 TaxID=3450742 RepID=UPI003F4279A3